MDEIAKRKIGEKVSLVSTALEETIHSLEVHRDKGTPDVEPLLEKATSALRNMEASAWLWKSFSCSQASHRSRRLLTVTDGTRIVDLAT